MKDGITSRNTMSNLKDNPYLSIVMTSRNDDYGGNALRRMQVSINGRLEQLEKYHIASELILVDWNPPSDKPLLKDVWASMGVYLLGKDIMKVLPKKGSIEIEVVPKIKLKAYKHRGFWVTVNTKKDIEEAERVVE